MTQYVPKQPVLSCQICASICILNRNIEQFFKTFSLNGELLIFTFILKAVRRILVLGYRKACCKSLLTRFSFVHTVVENQLHWVKTLPVLQNFSTTRIIALSCEIGLNNPQYFLPSLDHLKVWANTTHCSGWVEIIMFYCQNYLRMEKTIIW